MKLPQRYWQCLILCILVLLLWLLDERTVTQTQIETKLHTKGYQRVLFKKKKKSLQFKARFKIMLRAVSKFDNARDSRDTRRRSLRGACTPTLERLCVFCLLIVFLAEIRHYSKCSLKHFECMLPFSNGWGVHSFLKGHRSWTTMQMLYHRLAALKENLQGLLLVPQAFHEKIEDSLSWW